ncbi:DUF6350 family protein [Microbacterium protaetiae]|uniref:cell division protein PerM n=1 Tax=Microbacterium protaetiae TaxID=2509458 RepID=UPI001A911C97|nr:DUF6350 family protein [Microbacterium protaetiae]
MHRLLIALLSAFDALIAAAVGLAVALATLTVLWVAGIGAPEWSALWPVTAGVWQLGHLVPFTIHLSAEYLAVTGIPDGAASIALSLAPLAFACFTAYRGVRSGIRAGRSGAWITGVAGAAVAFAVVAAVVGLTSRTPVAVASLWQAVLLPTLVFLLPCLAGAVGAAWRSDSGVIGRLRELIDDLPGLWPEVPALALRGAGIVLTAVTGIGALGVIAALLLRGDEVIALYQAANLDATGVIVVSLAQLAYLPTLIVWALSFIAGPGFAVGTATAVSPAGTQLGVVPGIPVLGLLPESVSPWLLLLVLLPIGAGVLAGWMLRGQMPRPGDVGAGEPAVRGASTSWRREDYGVRAGVAVGVAVLSAAGAALAAWAASGAFGPGRLALVGPHPGAVALAVGVEVLIGVGILLLTPEGEGGTDRGRLAGGTPGATGVKTTSSVEADRAAAQVDRAVTSDDDTAGEDDIDTAPIDPGFLDGPDEIRP